ncbi:hypothetical protein COLO4_29630 [Corchorus olitorius]|uniref:Transposase, Ptta/En/Spm, plant n=1 Tax=Corchorus olitorius TaxID=93759 RepID=A0A1R3HDT6_9ROSI|nr:hypothetical protein COLO4_29630 [Corchorus olitorius]
MATLMPLKLPIAGNISSAATLLSSATNPRRRFPFSFVNAPIAPKKVRGPTRGVELERFNKAKGKMVIEIPEGKGRPVSEIQSAKLSSELGLISRRFIPIPTKWRNLTDADKMQAMDRLKTRFEIDLEDEYTESSVMSILSKQSAKKPKCLDNKSSFLITKGLEHLLQAVMAKRTNDQEPNRMEWFKLSHFSEAKGWKTHWAQEAYVEMERLLSTPVEEGQEARTIDSIVDQVLGTRAGYIKGLGYGPKPMKKTKPQMPPIQIYQESLQETRTNFEKLREQMHVMAQAMVAAGIQVPMSEFDDSRDANSSEISSSSQSLSTQDMD